MGMGEVTDEVDGDIGFATKLRILHAVDSPLVQMTVREICEKAGVSRQTFYRYFENKEDIAAWYSQHCERAYLDEVGRTLTWEEGYRKHFQALSRESRALAAALKDTMNPPFFGGFIVSVRRRETMLLTLRKWHGVTVDDSLLFCVNVFAHLESEIAQEWCRQGLGQSASFYADRMVSVVPSRLYAAMQLPQTDD